MNMSFKIPPYRERTQPNQTQKDVITKEMHQLGKELQGAKRKNRKWKERYAKQKYRRKQAERQLEAERSAAIQHEKYITLKTKLDDLAFFRGDTQKEDSQ